jgi:hypothetical protein
MLSTDTIMVAIASTVTMVAELEAKQPVPRGVVYSSLEQKLGFSFIDYTALEYVLQSKGWAIVTAEQLRLTDEGRKLAARLEALAKPEA